MKRRRARTEVRDQSLGLVKERLQACVERHTAHYLADTDGSGGFRLEQVAATIEPARQQPLFLPELG